MAQKKRKVSELTNSEEVEDGTPELRPNTSARAGRRYVTRPKKEDLKKKSPVSSNEKFAGAKKSQTAANDTARNGSTPRGARGRGKDRTQPSAVEAQHDPNEPNQTRNTSSDGPQTSDQPRYWLMKAEPESRIEKGVDVKFSIDDLKALGHPEAWDGVRNYVARNHMRAMKVGDLAFFYHSNCKNPGIVGTMRITGEATVDETAFDDKHPYYDAKDSPEKSKWSVVHVEFESKFPHVISLLDLKANAKDGGELADMTTLKQSRLSVSNVAKKEWDFIMQMAKEQETNGST